MGTTIFWLWCPYTLPTSCSYLWTSTICTWDHRTSRGIVVLLLDSVIPNQCLGRNIYFSYSMFPTYKSIRRYCSFCNSRTRSSRKRYNLGDSIVGSVAGLIYNASWLDYAISNEGCWLIFINWFLACMGIWLFAGYTITNRFLKR